MRARLKREIERLRAVLLDQQRDDPLDVVDLLAAMELSVGGDAAEVWHRHRERMGVEDDGPGEQRITSLLASSRVA